MTRAVKSAIRVLEVFEYFRQHQTEATVTDIVTELGYPQSSTSTLLHNLLELGYLRRGEVPRSFVPTARIAALGSWITLAEAPSGNVLALMQDLGDATGQTIILSVLLGDVVRYVHVVPATTAVRLHVVSGLIRPLLISASGRLFMSTMPEAEVRRLVAKHNSGEADDNKRLSMATVRRDLANIRDLGYALSLDRYTPGAGGIAMSLPDEGKGAQQAVMIGGVSRTLKERELVFAKLIRDGIHRHFGVRLPRGRKPQRNGR